MENYFKVDYDARTIYLCYQGEEFTFDLTKGDVGDYWNSFTTKYGETKDINFYQESVREAPGLSVYDLDADGYIDTSKEESIKCWFAEGDYDNYFNPKQVNQEHISAVIKHWEKHLREIDTYLYTWFCNLPFQAKQEIMDNYDAPDRSDYIEGAEGDEEYQYEVGEWEEGIISDFDKVNLEIKINDFKRYAHKYANHMAPDWDFVGNLF